MVNMINKENKDKFRQPSCSCGIAGEGLFLPNRQVGFVLVGLLLTFTLVFMAAYFLGKKQATIDSAQPIEQQLFDDQLDYQYAFADQESVQEESTSLPIACSRLEDEQSAQSDQDLAMVPQELLTANDNKLTLNSKDCFYGELIGFGKEQSAQSFVKKLADKGITVLAKKRMSKTAKGKTMYWFQVVTELFTDRDQVVELVNKITKEERLKNTRIVVCLDQKLSRQTEGLLV